MPLCPRIDWRTCVKACIRVAFIQVKNGLLAFACRFMKSIAASDVSSSIVSIRFLVSGPVSSILPPATLRMTPRGVIGLEERRIVLRPIRLLGLFLGIEVIQIAEELVEAVIGRQILVEVAEMVLAELSRRIAQRLERLGDGDVAVLQADRSAGRADLGQAGAQAGLAGDERRAARRAAVLRVIVGEHHAFLGDAVDVRRLVAHHAERVGADVGLADVVAEDDEDVRLAADGVAAGAAAGAAFWA